VDSGNSLDSVIVGTEFFRFLSHYQGAVAQKYQRYCDAEFSRSKDGEQNKRASLAKEFSKYRVDFEKDVYPSFLDTYFDFVQYLSARKAVAETAREIREYLKRYRLAVQLLTEDEAPFPAGLKEGLKESWAAFQRLNWEERMLRGMRRNWGDDTKFVSGETFTKALHKHPAWKALEKKLYYLLTGKGLSQRQALRLIALLLKTLVPHGLDTTHTEDTIRHRVTAAP
jgi:hypothetical protein